MLKKTFDIAVPIMIIFFCTMFIETANLAFIGIKGTNAMISGLGIAAMCFNLSVVTFVIGFNSGLSTLVSQSYGMGDIKMCGIHLNRSRVSTLIIMISLTPFLLYIEKVLIFIGIKEDVAYHAYEFTIYSLPGWYFWSMYDCMRNLLNFMGKSRIPLKSIPITIVLHFLWCYIFVVYLDYQVKGIGIATSITYSLNSLTVFLFSYCDKDLKEVLVMPTRDAFTGLWNFWKIGIPSAALLCLDFWSFEIMMLLSGYLPTNETAVQVIIVNIMFIFATVTSGPS